MIPRSRGDRFKPSVIDQDEFLVRCARDGDDIAVVARARSFLHHQVRNMVGTLKLVGEGKWSRADVETALAACDRTKGGPTAPADGLYLTDVIYPEATSSSLSSIAVQ